MTRTLVEGFRVYAYTDPEKCSWCVKAKDLLDKVGAFYAVFDIADAQHRQFIKDFGLKTVPQTWHGEKYIGGYEALEAYLKNHS
jgi:glutaredoxin